MADTLSIKTKKGPKNSDVFIIEFQGDFDKAGHSDIRSELDEQVKSFEGKNLIFDFSDLRYINSESIGYLMEIHSFLMDKDKKLVLVGVKKNVADIFSAIGINEIIEIFESVDAFLNK